MNTKSLLSVLMAISFFAGLTSASLAQQAPQGSTPSQPLSHGKAMTIDCPPEAAAEAQTGQTVGGPPGTGSGSGLMAMPSTGPTQRVAGAITTVDSSRTNRLLEVGDVKLEVEPSTVILVSCKPASMADLKQGTKIKAAYEVKEPNRNVAMVIEVEG